jgi:hypothetical protein
MTTARQARTIFRPLADRHGDFAYTGGRELWLAPIHHTVSRVFVDRSYERGVFRIGWSIVPTFVPVPSLSDIIGSCWRHLYPPHEGGSPYWHWSDPVTVEAAWSVIEAEALPLLRSIDTLERWATYYRETFAIALTGVPGQRLVLDIALGDLSAARGSLETLLPQFQDDGEGHTPFYQYMRGLIMPVAEPLRAGDRAALARILHGWEADNIRGTKIEPFWEPTPFPLEDASA